MRSKNNLKVQPHNTVVSETAPYYAMN